MRQSRFSLLISHWVHENITEHYNIFNDKVFSTFYETREMSFCLCCSFIADLNKYYKITKEFQARQVRNLAKTI